MCVRKRKIKFFYVFLAMLCALCWDASPAAAQKKNISNAEKVIVAYHRLSGKTPDFERWTKTTLGKQDQAVNVTPEEFEQERLRLQYGFGTYDPPNEIFRIKTKVLSRVVQSNGKSYLATHFPYEKAMNAPYFPYRSDYIDIAVVINKLADYLVLELKDESAEKAALLLPDNGQDYVMSMEIHYRPSDAEKDPVILDGRTQHLLLGEIAYLGIHKPVIEGSGNASPIWEYFAPWHLNKNEQDLLDILNNNSASDATARNTPKNSWGSNP